MIPRIAKKSSKELSAESAGKVFLARVLLRGTHGLHGFEGVVLEIA
jgi:hypothetical protein